MPLLSSSFHVLYRSSLLVTHALSFTQKECVRNGETRMPIWISRLHILHTISRSLIVEGMAITRYFGSLHPLRPYRRGAVLPPTDSTHCFALFWLSQRHLEPLILFFNSLPILASNYGTNSLWALSHRSEAGEIVCGLRRVHFPLL